MALDNFIPEVWSARLIANLQKAQVFAQPGVCNRDYEGDIMDKGDTVRINAIGAITVGDYTKNTDHAAAQTLNDAQTVLSIDQAKLFNFQIDDVDKAQSSIAVMDAAMREAAYALSNTADAMIAGLYTDVPSDNSYGTEASPKTGFVAGNVYEYLVELGVILDQNNVNRDGRWVIVPPFVHGYLQKDDRFVGAGAQTGVLLNGQVGQAAGFTILVSNNVKYTTSTTCYKVLAGTSMAITFAEQVRKIESYRPQLRFADAVKGLHLYGAKVIRPEALAMLVINKT